ncbi:hypothetical protein ACNKFW_06160 [Paracoccus sp. TD-10]|nr:hypothetical protein [Paracoccus pantotrophus]
MIDTYSSTAASFTAELLHPDAAGVPIFGSFTHRRKVSLMK